VNVEIVQSIDEVDAAAWNSLVRDGNPFVRHEFLAALEHSGCVTDASGWSPRHLVIRDRGRGRPALLAAVPMYLKWHSWGEYVFDWGWARAYDQAGFEYYPKLVSCVPFTPAGGPRLLIAADADRSGVASAVVDAARRLADTEKASSIHWLFTDPVDQALLAGHGYLLREGTQFHWSNRGYRNFDHYLDSFSADRRKKVRRERRRVREAGVRFDWIDGRDAGESDWRAMYAMYRTTVNRHSAIPYLNQTFFATVGAGLGPSVRILHARDDGDSLVACAFFLEGGGVLYGRYWGARRPIADLHFEACFYRPIEYCIERGLKRFEAGAQGEHKLFRGLMPETTRSAHWLRHAGFAGAVSRFLDYEREENSRYRDILAEHAPFRRQDDGRRPPACRDAGASRGSSGE
jgi:hypothetical protein